MDSGSGGDSSKRSKGRKGVSTKVGRPLSFVHLRKFNFCLLNLSRDALIIE